MSIVQRLRSSALKQSIKKHNFRDFPGGPVVKNLSSNAGVAGSIPGRGTIIPHSAGQLSPRAATAELAHLNERAHVLQTTGPMCPGVRAPQLERDKSTHRN